MCIHTHCCAQEVFTDDNPRLSISGWYHAPSAPADAAQASLQQLQRGADAVTEYRAHAGTGCHCRRGCRTREGNAPHRRLEAHVVARVISPCAVHDWQLPCTLVCAFPTLGRCAVAGQCVHPTTTGGSPAAPLTEEDTALLLRYLNPAYLSEDAWGSVAERFKEEGSVQLRGFLRKGLADKVACS